MFLRTVFERDEVERLPVNAHFILLSYTVAGHGRPVIDGYASVGDEAVCFAARAKAVVANHFIDAGALIFGFFHN